MVKRPPAERKRLPPELEAFATGQETRLRLRRPRVDRGELRDPREGYVIAGVANRDARSVFDVRIAAMQDLWQGGEAPPAAREELGGHLCDALRLRLWRARRITDFAVMAEEIVGIPVALARELAEASSERIGVSLSALSERDVALWLRTEAGLFEGDVKARVRIEGIGPDAAVTIRVALEHASPALAGAGFRHAPLAREREAVRGPRPDREGNLRGGRRPDEAPEQALTPEAYAGEPPLRGEDPPAPPGARLLTRSPASRGRGSFRSAEGDFDSDRVHDERPEGEGGAGRGFGQARGRGGFRELDRPEREGRPSRGFGEKRPHAGFRSGRDKPEPSGRGFGKNGRGAGSRSGWDDAEPSGRGFGEKRPHAGFQADSDRGARGFGKKRPHAGFQADSDRGAGPTGHGFGKKRPRAGFQADSDQGGPAGRGFGRKRPHAAEARGFSDGDGDERGTGSQSKRPHATKSGAKGNGRGGKGSAPAVGRARRPAHKGGQGQAAGKRGKRGDPSAGVRRRDGERRQRK